MMSTMTIWSRISCWWVCCWTQISAWQRPLQHFKHLRGNGVVTVVSSFWIDETGTTPSFPTPFVASCDVIHHHLLHCTHTHFYTLYNINIMKIILWKPLVCEHDDSKQLGRGMQNAGRQTIEQLQYVKLSDENGLQFISEHQLAEDKGSERGTGFGSAFVFPQTLKSVTETVLAMWWLHQKQSMRNYIVSSNNENNTKANNCTTPLARSARNLFKCIHNNITSKVFSCCCPTDLVLGAVASKAAGSIPCNNVDAAADATLNKWWMKRILSHLHKITRKLHIIKTLEMEIKHQVYTQVADFLLVWLKDGFGFVCCCDWCFSGQWRNWESYLIQWRVLFSFIGATAGIN